MFILIGTNTYLLVHRLGMARFVEATHSAHLPTTKDTHRESADCQSHYRHDDFPWVRGAESTVGPKVLGELALDS